MNAPRSCDGQIMVVEDDPDVRASLEEVLEDADYQPISAANGRDALDRLRECEPKPCVILLDMMMPVMDGREFRSAQQQDPELAEIPVVLLSADARLEQTAEALKPAAALRKPVDLAALLEAVEKFCR